MGLHEVFFYACKISFFWCIYFFCNDSNAKGETGQESGGMLYSMNIFPYTVENQDAKMTTALNNKREEGEREKKNNTAHVTHCIFSWKKLCDKSLRKKKNQRRRGKK